MEIVAVVAVLVVVVALVVLAWRPPRGRRRTAEEALESDALRREQEKNLTDATYEGDRYQVRPRR
ncbi:MAG: hypothetical protein MUE92_00530 [Chloroflexi bacterium]|jgi:hypothetical protein|nr:hypothetical protein [Chloroflexota bacterium]